MAFAVNKAIILGNLGKDIEVRYTQSGKAVTNFSVATEEGSGENKKTEWHTVVAWDKLAELCGKLIGKGNKVYVEGRLQTREYDDKDGNKRWSTEIVAREMVFLTTRNDQQKQPHEPARGREQGSQGGSRNQQSFGGGGGRKKSSYDDGNF
jgi:single-strand DNA-binding protein